MKQEYEALFTPWHIGNVEIKTVLFNAQWAVLLYSAGWSLTILTKKPQIFYLKELKTMSV